MYLGEWNLTSEINICGKTKGENRRLGTFEFYFFTHCVTIGWSLNLSVPQFPQV